jgi:hypothetical protein
VHQLRVFSKILPAVRTSYTLFTAAPRPSHLDLRYYPCDLTAVAEREMRRSMIALEHLEVADTWREIGRPPDWLTVLSMRRLILLALTTLPYHIPFWKACINEFGALLRELALEHTDTDVPHCHSSTYGSRLYTHLDMNLDLSPLTELRTIEIVSGYNTRPLVLPLFRTLQMLDSPYLESTTLALEDMDPERLRQIDWAAVRNVCGAVRVRSTRLRVVFGLPRRYLPDDVETVMECEQIVGEAIEAYGLVNLVCVERTH